MSQISTSMLSPTGASITEGFAHFGLVLIGGLTAQAQDATNDLSYAIPESTRVLQISQPDVGARVHSNTRTSSCMRPSKRFKDGKGTPKSFNDKALIPYCMDLGIRMDEALDCNPLSCADSRGDPPRDERRRQRGIKLKPCTDATVLPLNLGISLQSRAIRGKLLTRGG